MIKNALTFIVLLLTTAHAIGQAATGSYIWAQKPASGPLVSRELVPTAGRLVGFPVSVDAPATIIIGSGLTLTGSTLSATGSGGVWGTITGTLSNQTDLNTALGLKAPLISPSFTTPALGVATATSIAIGGGTAITGSTKLAAIESLANAAGLLTNDGSGVFSYTSATDAADGSNANKVVKYNGGGALEAFSALQVNSSLNGTTYISISGESWVANNVGPTNVGVANFSFNNLTTAGPFAYEYPAGSGTFAISATSPIVLNATTGNLTLSDVPYSSIAQGTALSVLGVTGNATADNASIAAASDHQVLRRSGTAVAFGAVNLASSNAVTGILGVGNLSFTKAQLDTIISDDNAAYVGTANTFTAAQTVTVAAAVSTSGIKVDGTWSTAGDATTDKPSLLIEPAGTTSTGWDTNGTGLGVNAATGFTGQLLDLQLAGATKFKVSSTGSVMLPNTTQVMIGTADATNMYYHAGGILFQVGGANAMKFVPANGMNFGTNYFGGSASVFDGTMDTGLIRDGAAGVLALKNSTNQMKFRVYGTTTSSKYTEVTHNGTNAIITDNGTGIIIRTGAGTPEAAITAPVGSLYLRSDGGANTTLYIKESGTGNTGWIAK